MTGDSDYLLRVVVPDLEAYERFVMDFTKIAGHRPDQELVRPAHGQAGRPRCRWRNHQSDQGEVRGQHEQTGP